MYLFLSLKWWQSSILWSVLCRFHSLYHCSHSRSLISIRCHSLSLFVTSCHSLSLVVPLVVTRCVTCCHSLYHSLSLFVIRYHLLPFVVTQCTTRSQSLSFVVTRFTTRLSFHKRSVTPFSYVTKQDKNLSILETKGAFKIKYFFV